jgi:2-iminobutanoate/2-iminopropanoate deaminase
MPITDVHADRRSIFQMAFAIVGAAIAGVFRAAPAGAQEPSAQKADANTAQMQKLTGLFAGSVTHGGLVYVAGKGEHGPGDIKVHTESVINQIEEELKKAGSSMDKVLKVNVYLKDIRDYDAMNEVYRGRFTRPPVRTTVACPSGIPGKSLVEIDCIAAL